MEPEKKAPVRIHISFWDIIKSIDPIHISCAEKLNYVQNKYDWNTLDARATVFYNICSLSENLNLTLSAIIFTKHNGLHKKEWWHDWAGYADVDKAFRNIPDFDTYADDQVRQMIHRVQEQLAVTTQIYLEAFIRNTARQFGIEQNMFWRLKKAFLVDTLEMSDKDLLPLTIYQNLKNSLHNKGIHYNEKDGKLRFILEGYEFNFDHDHAVRISWDHYRVLILASCETLLKIVENPKVLALPEYSDRNIVVIERNEEDVDD